MSAPFTREQKEEAARRALYQGWTTERLVRAATVEKEEYLPEAVPLMLEELQRRGVSLDDAVRQISIPKPPPIPGEDRDTLFFPHNLNRKSYAIRFSIWLLVLFVGSIQLEIVPSLQPSLFFLCVLAMLIYRVAGLDIPRLRNAGWSPWLLFLLLVPFVNLVLMLFLFFAPPRKQRS